MDKTTKTILFIFFAPGTIWDLMTTWSGVNQITNAGFFAFILTAFINGILALTFIRLQKTDFIGSISTVLWIAALIGDLTTSFYGNWRVVDIPYPSNLQYFLIGLSAIFTTGSTIAFSYIVFKEDIFSLYSQKK